ncbi:hypothetical protein KAR91_16555 [Candidatus Pacearchaeota archaeon]|nr:hypothetical protein [Candidatus Pacearchaeota archaeon]
MTESENITQRLGRLERQNRYMKLAGLAIALLVGVSMLTGAAKKPEIADEIRAKMIVVVDATGKPRIVMAVKSGKIGFSGISLYDSKGNARLFIQADDSYSSFSLMDSKGEDRLYMSSHDDQDDGGSIAILNKTGEEVVDLYVDEYGNGVVGAYNRKGVGRTLKPGP